MTPQGWEATEAATPAWEPATEIDWAADTRPVPAPKYGTGSQPADLIPVGVWPS